MTVARIFAVAMAAEGSGYQYLQASAIPAPHHRPRLAHPFHRIVLAAIEFDLSPPARFGTDFAKSPPLCAGVAVLEGCDGGTRGSLRVCRRNDAGLVL